MVINFPDRPEQMASHWAATCETAVRDFCEKNGAPEKIEWVVSDSQFDLLVTIGGQVGGVGAKRPQSDART